MTTFDREFVSEDTLMEVDGKVDGKKDFLRVYLVF